MICRAYNRIRDKTEWRIEHSIQMIAHFWILITNSELCVILFISRKFLSRTSADFLFLSILPVSGYVYYSLKIHSSMLLWMVSMYYRISDEITFIIKCSASDFRSVRKASSHAMNISKSLIQVENVKSHSSRKNILQLINITSS